MRKNRVLSMSLVALVAVVATLLLMATFAAAEPAAGTPVLQGGEETQLALGPDDAALALVAPRALAAPRAQLLDPDWHKWVNGVPWSQGMVVTVETSDTIKVVDVVTTLPNEPLELVEQWTPGELKLLDVQVQPGGSTHSVEVGRVTWQVPEGRSTVFTLTKWFHVEPCTWDRTVLTETLSVPGQPPVERLVAISKAPPALWIDSAYDPVVRPGDVATLMLRYGNAGGYENAVWIRNNFPPEAPFAWSDPPPDVVGPGRLMARWNVGDLAKDDVGEILVAIAITETVSSPFDIVVWDGIYNHVNVERDAVESTFTVEAPVPVA